MTNLKFPVTNFHNFEFTTSNSKSIFELVDPNKMYSIKFSDVIGSETRTIIHDMVLKDCGVEIDISDEAPFRWKGVVDNAEDAPYAGTFLKRLLSYLHKEHHTKLTNPVVGVLGNIIGKEMGGAGETFNFMFDPMANYIDGEFGDGGSCFWGAKQNNRIIVRNEGGAFVEFYNNPNAYISKGRIVDGVGLGRAWVLPVNQFAPEEVRDEYIFLLCNVYSAGLLNRYNAIRSVSTLLGMTYRNVDVSSNILYINSGAGYLMSHSIETMNKVSSSKLSLLYANGYNSYSIDPELKIGKKYCCRVCGREFRDNEENFETIFRPLDRTCLHCWEEAHPKCDKCGERPDRLYSCGKRKLCGSCAHEEGFYVCCSCNNWRLKTVVDSKGNRYCPSCASALLEKCSECGTYFSAGSLYRCGTENLCAPCAKIKYTGKLTSCSHCGKKTMSEFVNEDGLCNDCSSMYHTCKSCGQQTASKQDQYCYQCSRTRERNGLDYNIY